MNQLQDVNTRHPRKPLAGLSGGYNTKNKQLPLYPSDTLLS